MKPLEKEAFFIAQSGAMNPNSMGKDTVQNHIDLRLAQVIQTGRVRILFRSTATASRPGNAMIYPERRASTQNALAGRANADPDKTYSIGGWSAFHPLSSPSNSIRMR